MPTAGDGFSVPLEQLDAAAAACSPVVDGVRGVALAGSIGRLGTFLPGSRSALAAASVAAAWSSTITVVADGLAAHGAGLAEAARRYRDADRAVGDSLVAALGTSGGTG